MPIIPLKCPSCAANITVDSDKDAAICEFCGTPYVVKDTIVKNYISNVINIQADTVNVINKEDYEIEGGKLVRYRGKDCHVVIPDSVKIIGCMAFSGGAIESVEIPDSVVEIEDGGSGEAAFGTFHNLKYLKKINIPDSVPQMPSQCFQGCTSLESVTIGDRIKKIPSGAFWGCKSLKTVVIGKGVREIGSKAFYGCAKLTTVQIGHNVDVVGSEAFSGCRLLNNASFIANAERIEAYAFSGCAALQDVSYPDYCFAHTLYASSYGTDVPEEVCAFEGSPYGDSLYKEILLRRKNKVCQYCGSSFKGFGKKVCSNRDCGVAMDYR